MQGMDAARVREVAQALRGCARDLEEVRVAGTASAGVLGEVWWGGDAEFLLRSWADLTPALVGAGTALEEASATLMRQAADQESASDEGGGAAPFVLASSTTPLKVAEDTNPAPREALADVDPETGAMSRDAAQRWRDEQTDGVNPAWDVDPEDGTAVVSGRGVPNGDFAGKTYGGPDWSEETSEEHGPQWSEELQEAYPDGVEIDEFGFPNFYPYASTEYPPVLVELTTTSSKDIRLAYEAAGIDKDTAKELQEDWVWHHTHAYDPETGRGELILIPRDLHAAVKHAGGRSLHKHNGAETSD
ncbi:HNH endonuclease [Janibacter sp. FSL W8-0316]|uniref:HNH endonuclease n=1 Tax=Janibacter sp. FSL W8-0316 TaxID=2975325 RepID=UPI0030F675C7